VDRPAGERSTSRSRRNRRPPHAGAGTAAAVVVVVVAAVVSGACGGTTPSHADGSGRTNATVVRVVDGDTMVADIHGTEERVRFLGIDTPESVKPNAPVECFGEEASSHTKELLPAGTPVRLVLDVEERDRYDRLLAYVYTADGSFVNLALAEDGYAGLLTYPPNVAHVDELREAVAAARSAGKGLWSACADDLPVPSS
jgi:micrococcal nuclease